MSDALDALRGCYSPWNDMFRESQSTPSTPVKQSRPSTLEEENKRLRAIVRLAREMFACSMETDMETYEKKRTALRDALNDFQGE